MAQLGPALVSAPAFRAIPRRRWRVFPWTCRVYA
jgi:hypothetical protein